MTEETPNPRAPTAGLLALPPRGADEPKSHWLYRALRDAIQQGNLRGGDRLPTTRELSTQYGISRGTAVEVYEQLCAEGYTLARFGAGTFVATGLQDSFFARRVQRHSAPPLPPPALSQPGRSLLADAGAIFTVSEPATELRPFTLRAPGFDLFPRKTWARLTQRVLGDDDAMLAQTNYPDDGALRHLLIDYLRQMRGVVCEPRQIFFPSSIGNGLQIVMHLLLERGDGVWLEDPGQPMAPALATKVGVEPVAVPIDRDGMDVDVAMRCRADARLALVTPAHQDLFGSAMSLQRRVTLLEWAERSDGWVFEADYDSEFRYHGRPSTSLHQLNEGRRVFYSGSLSRLLFPATRIAYLIVPLQLVEQFRLARTHLLHDASTQQLAVLADFMAGGHFERHLRRCREAFRQRLTVFRQAVANDAADLLQLDPADAGCKLVGWLQGGLGAAEAQRRAAAAGFVVTPTGQFNLQRTDLPAGLLLGFASVPAERIPETVRRMAAALRNG